MKRTMGILGLGMMAILIAWNANADQTPPAKAAQPAEPPKKLCQNPDGKNDITVCDFGAVITIYGQGWGNSFRKIDLVPPQPAPAPHKKKHKEQKDEE